MKRILFAPDPTDGGGGAESTTESAPSASEAPDKRTQKKIDRLTSDNAVLAKLNDELQKQLDLLKADPAVGSLRSQIGQLEELLRTASSENEALRNRVAEFDSKAREKAAEEKLIAEKTQVGLSRAQALAVIQRQKDHDAALEKVWGERRSEIVQVLKECKCATGKVTREARLRIREIHGAIVLDEIKAAQKSLEAPAATDKAAK
ncbi:MAG TPA: hypothetical protein VGY56_10670 [Verrucomicrobiae bacterium]|nr:hypothetical protein [Verrucomicrobiae bacterium]